MIRLKLKERVDDFEIVRPKKKKADLLNVDDYEEDNDKHFIIVDKNVPEFLEYEQDKILMIVGRSIQLYEQWKHIKTIEIELKDNVFTQAN